MITIDGSPRNGVLSNEDTLTNDAAYYSLWTPQQRQSRTHHLFNINIARALHARLLPKLAHLRNCHPDITMIHAPFTVIMPAPNSHGFPMAITTEGGRYTLRFGEWSDDFARAEEAIQLIDDAMRGNVRLKVIVDNHLRVCTLERQLPDGMWLEQPRTDAAQASTANDSAYAIYYHNDFTGINWPRTSCG